MMEQFGVVFVALAAFVGGMLLWLLGWLQSSEPFVVRKFALSLVMALLAGIGFGLAYGLTDSTVTSTDILQSVLAGAGWEGIGYAGVKVVAPR